MRRYTRGGVRPNAFSEIPRAAGRKSRRRRNLKNPKTPNTRFRSFRFSRPSRRNTDANRMEFSSNWFAEDSVFTR